jgi:glycosyltransferase involved in cell wall biosynthesis
MATIKHKKSILILTPFFYPNIGGVETHLSDLVTKLTQLNYRVFVQTYSPITTPNTKWKKQEKSKNLDIHRYYWFGKQLFHKIEKYPFFDFLYLTPYLFIRSFLWMIKNHKKIDIIHCHGFNASLVGVILKFLFHKKLITSTHAIYEISPKSTTAKIITLILNQSDVVLALSSGSLNELIKFGVKSSKLHLYKYWIQTKNFYHVDKFLTRQKFNIENKFTVLFVGRLIRKKGIRILVKVAKNLPKINFLFIGTGPEKSFLSKQTCPNIKYLGPIPNEKLINYYNCADIFCIPSLYQEGFGRVVMEAVACGLPVIGSNKGGIKEALDPSVSILVKPTFSNIKNNILKISQDKLLYQKLQSNTLRFSKINFSEKNIHLITKYY